MIRVNVGNNLSRKNVIVDENETLRAVLEANQVDYARYPVSLDGSTLQPGDLNKTFVEMGFDGTAGKDSCYLLAVAKADNAAPKIKIVGGAAVVVSDFTPDEIKKIEKFDPDAMSLFKGEGKNREPYFTAKTGKGPGSLGCFGAVYGDSTNADGKATITLSIPGGKDPKEWAQDHIGKAIIDLGKVEANFADALQNAEAQDAAVAEAIEVL